MNKSYTLSSSETSASSLVSDVIRRIDLEAAKFSRLISTLPTGVDVTGLSLPDADLLVSASQEFATRSEKFLSSSRQW